MTVEEKQEWLEVKYPLTIISDRYDGTYSGGGWLAFPLYCDEIPPAVNGYDEDCAQFWKDYKEPVGKGAYASDAVTDLIRQMREFEPEESEDERIRKALIDLVSTVGEYYLPKLEVRNKMLTYLEKQKEQEQPHHLTNSYSVMSPKEAEGEIAKLLLKSSSNPEQKLSWSEDDENVYNGLIKQLERTMNKEDIYEVSKVNGYKVWLKHHYIPKDKQEWSEEDEENYQSIRAILLEDTTKKIGKRTYGDVLEWYESKGNGRFNLPKIKWSEEDEKMIERLITRLNWITYNTRTDGTSPNITFFDEIEWLKSLRPHPHWKPSEEQIYSLGTVVKGYDECTVGSVGYNLKELYEHLKKL